MQHVLTSQIHPELPPEIWEIILKRTDPGTCLTFCRSDLISDCDLETTLREMLVAGNLAGIQTLYGRISAAFYRIDSAVREILVAGNLAHFQTLYGTLPATYKGMDTRAIIDLLTFLHNNQHLSGRGGSERAMDVAAENGHLHVVRWLHENWAYGCSALAMNSALKMVILTSFDGCTRIVTRGARNTRWTLQLQMVTCPLFDGCTRIATRGAQNMR